MRSFGQRWPEGVDSNLLDPLNSTKVGEKQSSAKRVKAEPLLFLSAESIKAPDGGHVAITWECKVVYRQEKWGENSSGTSSKGDGGSDGRAFHTTKNLRVWPGQTLLPFEVERLRVPNRAEVDRIWAVPVRSASAGQGAQSDRWQSARDRGYDGRLGMSQKA